jgi:hypothetical protein
MFRSNYRAGILLKLDSLEVSTKRVGLESRDQLSTLLLFCLFRFNPSDVYALQILELGSLRYPILSLHLLALRIPRTTQARNILSPLAFAFTEPLPSRDSSLKSRALQTLHLAGLINRSNPARGFIEANPDNVLRPETAFPAGDFNDFEHFMEQLPANAPPIHLQILFFKGTQRYKQASNPSRMAHVRFTLGLDLGLNSYHRFRSSFM